MRRSGGPGRRREIGLEQAMQMDDVIARLRAVDRRLRLGAPCALGAGEIGKDADDIELRRDHEIRGFPAISIRRQTPGAVAAALTRLGPRIGRGHGSHFLEGARRRAAQGSWPFALVAAKTQAADRPRSARRRGGGGAKALDEPGRCRIRRSKERATAHLAGIVASRSPEASIRRAPDSSSRRSDAAISQSCEFSAETAKSIIPRAARHIR